MNTHYNTRECAVRAIVNFLGNITYDEAEKLFARLRKTNAITFDGYCYCFDSNSVSLVDEFEKMTAEKSSEYVALTASDWEKVQEIVKKYPECLKELAATGLSIQRITVEGGELKDLF